LTLADRWILSRLNGVIDGVTKALGHYRFNEAEALVYDFVWHDFCDWYVEISKPQIIGKTRGATGMILINVLEESLKLLHPFMPFVTEAVWQNIKERDSIMTANWPVPDKKRVNKTAESEMDAIKEIVVSVRNLRSDMNIPHSTKLVARAVPLKKKIEGVLSAGRRYIIDLANLEDLVIDKDFVKRRGFASIVLENLNIFISLEGVIDLDAERKRLTKKKESLESQLVFTEKRMKDRNFTEKAPEEVVNAEKDKCARITEQIERLEITINEIQS
ncbi:MAG: class I tRNA ligase family protein, partial [Candidatus Omnitrophota bacterium]